MRVFLALIVGIAIGVAAVWYFHKDHNRSQFQTAGDEIKHTAQSVGTTFQNKLAQLHLRASDITNELAKTGRVIRQKAQQVGQAIAEASSDARITATIKAKIVRESDLSVWDISVSTTDGVVTLSGKISSVDNISKAMALAMDTDGVKQVNSTLQVKGK